MKLNALKWVGVLMILSGLENIFRTTPYSQGAKNSCNLGVDCLYIGSFWIILGLVILLVQYNIKTKNKN